MDVRVFQEHHKNHQGLPLGVDGDIGPETQWALDFETICLDRKLVVYEAWKYRGLIEVPPGSNSDPAGIIQAWLERAGAEPGAAWCASSLSAWLSAAKQTKIPGALNLVRSFPRVAQPFISDVGGFPTDNKGHGHCFLILGVSKDGSQLLTWEGNSNNAVRCVRRYRTPEMIFGRTFPDVTGRCPGVISAAPLAGGGTR